MSAICLQMAHNFKDLCYGASEKHCRRVSFLSIHNAKLQTCYLA
jgi:hypothetical protein